MTDTILTGLQDRRADLVRQARQTERLFNELIAQIDQIDAVIWQFDGNYKPDRPPVQSVGRIPMTRTVLTILRKSKEPMTLRELTLAMMESLGLDVTNSRRVTRVQEQVRTALTRQKANGVVEPVVRPGGARAMGWRVRD
jgi:hypothetical protein